MSRHLRRLRIKLLPVFGSFSPIAVIALATTLLASATVLYSFGGWRDSGGAERGDSTRKSLLPSLPLGKPGERETPDSRQEEHA